MQIQRNFKHLTMTDRHTLEKLLRAGESISRIAQILEKHISTIYRELKKGKYEHIKDNYFNIVKEQRYAAELAQKKYELNLKNKGKKLKIIGDVKQINYINTMLSAGLYSPQSVLYLIQKNEIKFDVKINSVNTLYSYIKKGIFPDITMDLSLVKKKKHRKRKIKIVKKCPSGISIEKRPIDIDNREIFGHWEMDSVIGSKRSEKVILTFLERKTRKVILELAKNHSAIEVVRALNRIEKRYKSGFFSIFKSMTSDNGTEFSDTKGLQKALYRKGDRTVIYTCHPYCSFERGSNENVHKFIRRFFPKGESFKNLSRNKLKEIEQYINNYPRHLFKGKCAEEIFKIELEILHNTS